MTLGYLTKVTIFSFFLPLEKLSLMGFLCYVSPSSPMKENLCVAIGLRKNRL